MPFLFSKKYIHKSGASKGQKGVNTMAVKIHQKSEEEKREDRVEKVLEESGAVVEKVSVNGVDLGIACCANEADKTLLEEVVGEVSDIASSPGEVMSLLMRVAEKQDALKEKLEKEEAAKAKEASDQENLKKVLRDLLGIK